jgi:folate-binding protein YgfZ
MPEGQVNLLRDLHGQAGAEFQAYADIEIPSTFGNTPAEYSALHKSSGLMDMPQRAVLEATGKDRLDFLNRLLTNQTYDKQKKTGLAAGRGVYSFLLNNKGRIVADMNVLELGDRTWLEMDFRMVEEVRKALDGFLFGEDVKLANLSGSLHEVALQGPKAAEVLGGFLGMALKLQPLESLKVTLLGQPAVVFRNDLCAASGFGIILPADGVAKVWTELLAEREGRPALRPIGWAAFNAVRIEAGKQIFGIDFDSTVLPGETGLLERAVSFNKGCYVGQEIVARMHSRGQVARQLVGIRMEDDALPIAGVPIQDDQGNAIGAVTSSTVSPVLSNAAICLGYVKKQFVAPGTVLTIPAEGAMRKGKVVELPFC